MGDSVNKIVSAIRLFGYIAIVLHLLRTQQGYEVATTNGKEQEAIAARDLVIINPPTTEVVNGQWVDPSEYSFLSYQRQLVE